MNTLRKSCIPLAKNSEIVELKSKKQIPSLGGMLRQNGKLQGQTMMIHGKKTWTRAWNLFRWLTESARWVWLSNDSLECVTQLQIKNTLHQLIQDRLQPGRSLIKCTKKQCPVWLRKTPRDPSITRYLDTSLKQGTRLTIFTTTKPQHRRISYSLVPPPPNYPFLTSQFVPSSPVIECDNRLMRTRPSHLTLLHFEDDYELTHDDYR